MLVVFVEESISKHARAVVRGPWFAVVPLAFTGRDRTGMVAELHYFVTRHDALRKKNPAVGVAGLLRVGRRGLSVVMLSAYPSTRGNVKTRYPIAHDKRRTKTRPPP